MTDITDHTPSSNGSGKRPASDRFDAPMYLARFRERNAPDDSRRSPAPDDGLPLYLKRFRDRGEQGPELGSTSTPLWQRADLGTQQVLTEDGRNKEISAPASERRVPDPPW
jgi:hypothetical protein